MGSINRVEEIKLFFRFVEKRFGNMKSLIESKDVGLIVTEELYEEDMLSLFQHKVSAIHVKKFYPKVAALSVAKRFEQVPTLNWQVSNGRGLESSDVASIGMPFNVALGKGSSTVDEYFSSARTSVKRMRRMDASDNALPMLGPIDQLRLELDETWRYGASITRDRKGRLFLPGAPRIMKGPTSSINGFIHVDDLSPISTLTGLFSANIYLKMPPTGGDLLVYPIAIRSRWDFYRNAATLSNLMGQGSDMQEVLRNALPKPYRIRPEPGDLVLICAQRPHAAEGFPIGVRVSVQSFITYKHESPLRMDS